MSGWAIGSAISVSLLILLVLAIRRPVARMFGARAAYALWLAPLLRALLPPLDMLLPTDPMSVTGGGALPAIVIVEVPAAATRSDLMPWAMLAWALGTAAYLAIHLTRHHLFVRDALAAGTRLAKWAGGHDVIVSDAVDGPVATGLLRRLIIVPANFAQRFTPAQQELALLHEQLHHRRGDLWASAAAMLVTAALWFNPFAHVALRAFRRDMEAACDSAVLSFTGPERAHDYAETILRCAARPVPRSLCALTSLDELKGRLTMLTSTHSPARKRAGLAIATLVAGAGLAIAIPAAAQENVLRTAVPAPGPIMTTRAFPGPNKVTVPLGDKTLAGPPTGACATASDRFVVELGKGGPAGGDQLSFIVCNEGTDSAAMIRSLEAASARVSSEGALPRAHRAQILAALSKEVARLKAM